MSQEKIIVVVGATGAQGGGLARAILDDPAGAFGVRAITRHPSSDKARALADRGAEVVEADSDDEASVRRAFAGAYGAYCVTNFWEHFSPEREEAQAATMARAARATGLRHVIWSTLEDTRVWVPLDDDRMPTLLGRYKAPHFRRQGDGQPRLHRAGGAHDVPADLVLLGQLHLPWHASAARPRRDAHAHVAHGRQEAPRDRHRGYRPVRLRT